MKQKYWLIKAFIILFVFFCLADFALAGSATVSWNANTESDLAGYRVYYGQSARTGSDPKTCGMCGYANKVDVGKVTTYTFGNLTEGQTYYFSVTAYDTSNNESAFSGQVSKLVSTSADLNSDSWVNAQDFSILMFYWGSASRPKADINQDGSVNAQDFSIMMAQWKTA